MGTTEPVIEIRGARKVYKLPNGKKRTSVEDVSLKVEAGTIHGLLGPNGAGKTTSLKMLLGLVRPTAGEFLVNGVDSTSPKGREALGFLPEQPYFPVQLTAAEALRLYGRLVGLGKQELAAETERLLALVGLEGRDADSLSKFSRGMLQRLGVAQALLGSPDVVVLDEPASGLDPVGQRDMRNLMLGLKQEGKTVLLSSHQLSEVEAVCDDVTIVNRGRVAAEGDIDDLLTVRGRVAVKASGLPEALPSAVAAFASEVAREADLVRFVVGEGDVRSAVDAVFDAGGTVLALNPKRDTLEDYFARMLAESGGVPEDSPTEREVA